jgi:hypothetical protein
LRVKKFDSMRWRIQQGTGPRPGSCVRGGRGIPCAEAFGGGLFEVAAGMALVADHRLAAVPPDREPPQRDIAFLLVGGGQDRRARRSQSPGGPGSVPNP